MGGDGERTGVNVDEEKLPNEDVDKIEGVFRYGIAKLLGRDFGLAALINLAPVIKQIHKLADCE